MNINLIVIGAVLLYLLIKNRHLGIKGFIAGVGTVLIIPLVLLILTGTIWCSYLLLEDLGNFAIPVRITSNH